jgi:hypothetical protein
MRLCMCAYYLGNFYLGKTSALPEQSSQDISDTLLRYIELCLMVL